MHFIFRARATGAKAIFWLDPARYVMITAMYFDLVCITYLGPLVYLQGP